MRFRFHYNIVRFLSFTSWQPNIRSSDDNYVKLKRNFFMVLIEPETYLSILLLLCTIRQSLGFLLICNIGAVMFNVSLVLFFHDVKKQHQATDADEFILLRKIFYIKPRFMGI